MSPSSEAPTKQKIGKYPVVKRLGVGAMGEVYEVEDPELGRHVALKILLPEMAANPTFLERFRREAVAMAQVRHPHVLQVYELGLQFKQPFFTMELVDGSDCATYIEQSRQLTVAELARIGMQAAQGLAAAAAVGLVHRDVKPANVMVDDDRRVRLMDFGLAKFLASDHEVTGAGHVVGTYRYMSPEQLQAEPLDARADLYSLGVVIYELLTGRVPYGGKTPLDLWNQVLANDPLPVTQLNPDADAQLARVAHRLMRKEPSERYQTAEEVFQALME